MMRDRPVIVIDDADSGFSSTAGWNPSTRDPGFHGKGYLWHAKGTGEGQAVWRADLPMPGRYNVYARWVMSKPEDRATNAPFTVKSLDGDSTVRVTMAEMQSHSEWNRLGTFAFDKQGEVVLSDDADNSVVADAVKFEYMEPVNVPPQRGRLLFSDDFETMENWFVEAAGRVELVEGAMRVISESHDKGIHAWFRPDLPDNVQIEYDMTLHGPEGFALVFFCTRAVNSGDMLGDLAVRDGGFDDYVRNPKMRSYHFSVHRKWAGGWVHGANLNKNPGKTLLQRNAVDPCPPAEGDQTYHMVLIKIGGRIQLFVNDELVLFYLDDEDPYPGGRFGFRQIYMTKIDYSNLRVYEAAMPEA